MSTTTRVSPGVVKVERHVLTLSERAYLPQVIGGMFRTLKHLLSNLVNIKKGYGCLLYRFFSSTDYQMRFKNERMPTET